MPRFVALLIVVLLGVSSPRILSAETVDAARYDAFWLWAGVEPQPVLAKAKAVYVLQGEIEGAPEPRMVAQRAATPRIPDADVWIVYRVETLRWTPRIHAQLLAQIERWRAAGNRLVGVQIDFDSGTRHLDEYGVFLRDLRARLPARYRLGITGLLDWSANGDPEDLRALEGVVDEVVLQIYQGRRVIPGYERYLARLGGLTIPFRVGLLQGGEWTPPPNIAGHPSFRGYVVFLQNPR